MRDRERRCVLNVLFNGKWVGSDVCLRESGRAMGVLFEREWVGYERFV